MPKLIEISTKSLGEILDLLQRESGYDFSGYSKASLKRRIRKVISDYKLLNMESLKNRIVRSKDFLPAFLEAITVNVTEMFRDPSYYAALRNKVVPHLKTFPHSKIWHAGCSSGEEMYSTAIVMRESEILHKSTFYGTDINEAVLKNAAEGIYEIATLKEYSRNYIQSGGTGSLSDYYVVKYGKAKMSEELRKRMVFSFHNLVNDQSFNEFQLIICRNVMIYFDRELQDRVLELFYESLPMFGYLVLGTKESLEFSSVSKNFEITDRNARIYRKIH